MAILDSKKLVHNWFFWIVMITIIAIFLRALPALVNVAWGCDFGIYYGLTNSFITSGEFYGDSSVWGGAYQYFPVLYAITGFAHWLTGIDVLTLMPKLVPVFGGLSIFIFYFIVYELLKDRRKALLSSLFLAVLPFHVYQTSQAAPLTIGHFFFMLCLYSFIRTRSSQRYFFLLFFSTVLLILTHHLTTYFYLISLFFIIIIGNARQKTWTSSIKWDVFYFITASGATFVYWSCVAKPVYDSFMNNGLVIFGKSISSNLVIALFYLLFFIMLGMTPVLRKFFMKKTDSSRFYSTSPLILLLIFFSLISVFGGISLLNLPWAKIYFTPKSVLFSIPLFTLISLGVIGFRNLRWIPNWQVISGWIYPLILSFIYGIATFNRMLLPHRHLEYIMAPLSILSVFGLYSLAQYDYSFLASWKTQLIKSRQLLFSFIIVGLVTTNAASVYPSYLAWEALDESYETITHDNLVVIQWMKENIDQNNTVIASDHRLALLAGAMGFNTTRDQALYLWNETNDVLIGEELFGIRKNYTHVTHILVDSIMRNHVVHIGFNGIKAYMSNESYNKFLQPPFELNFRNGTYNRDLQEIHWTELYTVNWTYITNKQWPNEPLFRVYHMVTTFS